MAAQYICDKCKEVKPLSDLQKLMVGKKYTEGCGLEIFVVSWDVCSTCIDGVKEFMAAPITKPAQA